MSVEQDLIDKLTTLNQISEALNRAVDVQGVLSGTLAELVKLMGLETGWIFVRDPTATDDFGGRGYVLAASHNLPPALELDNGRAWHGGCVCQDLCSNASLTDAYNEVRCSRLLRSTGDRRGLAMHASAPLRSGDQTFGILNVAGPDWSAFTPEALALLNNVGNLMGVALERARLFDLVQQQRVLEQVTLLNFSNQLLGHLELDELMRFLVREIREILQADASALLLPNGGSEVLEFRAATGWHADPVAAHRQVPADESSGPGLVMHTREPLQEEDIQTQDSAPWMCDWVQEEGFRGHAVAPLITDGRSVGALVVNTRQPRLLDEVGMRSLLLMANQAAIAIEKARLHDEEIKSQVLEKELEVGRQIQISLLPAAPPTLPGWEFSVFYQAARQVGGDFYDFFNLEGEPHRLGLVIADVTGKGVPAALFMAHSRTVIRATARDGRSPSAALSRANSLIVEEGQGELFLTAFYATLDPHSGRLVYANAGHNRPLWLQAGADQLQELDARGIIMGAFGEIELEEREIDVGHGDLLVFYTDGVTEAMNARHEMFGEERLWAAVAEQSGASADQILGSIVDRVRAFCGDVPQSDDLTLFVVRRCPQAE
ncbi:SpoIIE family protein phosphatase [Chloroflexota bacterium]